MVKLKHYVTCKKEKHVMKGESVEYEMLVLQQNCRTQKYRRECILIELADFGRVMLQFIMADKQLYPTSVHCFVKTVTLI